ncbi:hypothetical protein D3C72_1747560 [compost metagenome]
MQSLTTRRFAEADQAQPVQPITDFLGAFYDGLERHVGGGVQVENQTARLERRKGRTVPRVEFKGGDLGGGHEGLDPVKLQVGLLVSPHLYLGDQVGLPLARMPLEELLLALYAVRHPDNGTRAALYMLQHPLADRCIVFCEVLLGDRIALPVVRPKRFVSIRDGHSHDRG